MQSGPNVPGSLLWPLMSSLGKAQLPIVPEQLPPPASPIVYQFSASSEAIPVSAQYFLPPHRTVQLLKTKTIFTSVLLVDELEQFANAQDLRMLWTTTGPADTHSRK